MVRFVLVMAGPTADHVAHSLSRGRSSLRDGCGPGPERIPPSGVTALSTSARRGHGHRVAVGLADGPGRRREYDVRDDLAHPVVELSRVGRHRVEDELL